MTFNFKVNNIVKCKKSNELKYPFVGKITEIKGNELLVEILDYDSHDRYEAFNIDYLTSVPFEYATNVKIKKLAH